MTGKENGMKPWFDIPAFLQSSIHIINYYLHDVRKVLCVMHHL